MRLHSICSSIYLSTVQPFVPPSLSLSLYPHSLSLSFFLTLPLSIFSQPNTYMSTYIGVCVSVSMSVCVCSSMHVSEISSKFLCLEESVLLSHRTHHTTRHHCPSFLPFLLFISSITYCYFFLAISFLSSSLINSLHLSLTILVSSSTSCKLSTSIIIKYGSQYFMTR